MTITREQIADHLRDIAERCEHDLLDTGVLYMAADLLWDGEAGDVATGEPAVAEHYRAFNAAPCGRSTQVVVRGLLDEAAESQAAFLNGFKWGYRDGWRRQRTYHNDTDTPPYRRGYESGHEAGRLAIERDTGVSNG